MLLPSISLVYPVTNQEKIANMIYSFMKMDYPRDKLELVILDGMESDKYFKGVIPEDKRIKIVKMTNKNKRELNLY
jgi:cellulose synthase/poly-beta-1,6-N-acetylglucosamine synthase-like glycosyltransferase